MLENCSTNWIQIVVGQCKQLLQIYVIFFQKKIYALLQYHYLDCFQNLNTGSVPNYYKSVHFSKIGSKLLIILQTEGKVDK